MAAQAGNVYRFHVEEANRVGIVATSWKESVGLFRYKRTLVDPGERASVIDRLTEPAAADERPGRACRKNLCDIDTRPRRGSGEATCCHGAVSIGHPVCKSLDSMTVALVTIGYITTIGS